MVLLLSPAGILVHLRVTRCAAGMSESFARKLHEEGLGWVLEGKDRPDGG